jgi:hypothetical protein
MLVVHNNQHPEPQFKSQLMAWYVPCTYTLTVVSQLCSFHTKRVIVMPKDMRLLSALRAQMGNIRFRAN